MVTYRTRPGLDPSQRICAMPGVRGMPSGYGPTREAAKRDMARRAHSMPAVLDEHGRCCGRKPLFYKGGSWRSPKGAPLHFCCRCHREYGPDGMQRANWAWKAVAFGFVRVNAPESPQGER